MIPDFSNYITLTFWPLLLLKHRAPTILCTVLGPELSLSFHVVYVCSVLFCFFSQTCAPKCSLKWRPSLSLMKGFPVQGLMTNDTGLLCVWPSHLYLRFLCQITSTSFCCVLPHRFSFLMVSGQLSKRIETQTSAASAYVTYFTTHTLCWNKEIRYLH